MLQTGFDQRTFTSQLTDLSKSRFFISIIPPLVGGRYRYNFGAFVLGMHATKQVGHSTPKSFFLLLPRFRLSKRQIDAILPSIPENS